MRFADSFYICMCVFHSIRFKVNKVLGHSGDPFLFLYPSKRLISSLISGLFQMNLLMCRHKKCGLLQGRISYDGFHSYLSLEIEEFSYFFFLNFR